MTDLLPCPFCGNTPRIISPLDGYFDIACVTNGCFMELGADWHMQDEARIVRMWNRRASPTVSTTSEANP